MDYRTVEAYAAAEFVEKKSRFIGHIAPAASSQEALAFIEKISKEHWNASHNVYAYILREERISRCSDQGEPQGTAGVPVLDVLQKEGLTDVCVVVTRYFGGTLLGTGGLVRAYSHGAKIAVEAAHILEMAPCCLLKVECDYSFYGKLSYLLPNYGVRMENQDFGGAVILTFWMRSDRKDEFTQALTELSNGQYTTEILREEYADMPR